MSNFECFQQFDSLEICNLTPDSLDESEYECGKIGWHEKQFVGSWESGCSAGGCRNHIGKDGLKLSSSSNTDLCSYFLAETFASNPQFLITLEDSDDDEDDLCTCLVSLMQKGSRKKKVMKDGGGCLSIGNCHYTLTNPIRSNLIFRLRNLPFGRTGYRYVTAGYGFFPLSRQLRPVTDVHQSKRGLRAVQVKSGNLRRHSVDFWS